MHGTVHIIAVRKYERALTLKIFLRRTLLPASLDATYLARNNVMVEAGSLPFRVIPQRNDSADSSSVTDSFNLSTCSPSCRRSATRSLLGQSPNYNAGLVSPLKKFDATWRTEYSSKIREKVSLLKLKVNCAGGFFHGSQQQ